MEKPREERPITVAEVRALLQASEAELDQFQRRTLDYAEKFAKLDASKARELVSKLVADFALEEERAVQIVNSMPSSIEELRVFFTGGKRRLVTTQQLNDILGALNAYRERK
ncbi:MAG: RNA polymerase Rpb4 family protein [Candidatus Bathyarchaeia archaeon]